MNVRRVAMAGYRSESRSSRITVDTSTQSYKGHRSNVKSVERKVKRTWCSSEERNGPDVD